MNRMHIAVLSPHRDDAAFSCGLLLTHLLRAGAAVHVVNVCTVSDYAPWLAESGESRVAQVSAARYAEDCSFLERLRRNTGGDATMTDLQWLDSPLRLRMPADEVLTGQPLRSDEIRLLATELAPWAGFDGVLAPLGIGGHLDHRLVRQAARNAFAPEALGYYQDLPYACRMSAIDRANAAETTLADSGCEACLPFATLDSTEAQALKMSYAMCYPTQIDEAVAQEIAADAVTQGGRECIYVSRSLGERLAEALSSAPPRTSPKPEP